MRTIKLDVTKVFKVVDLFVRIALPISATAALILRAIKPGLIDSKIELTFILAIVAGSAISEGLLRFLTLDEIKRKVEHIPDYDIASKKLLDIAKNSGIVALSPRFNDEWLSDIIEEVKTTKFGIDICGVALPSIISKKALREALLKLAEKNDIRILLLDPDCHEATRRANIEKPLGTRTIEDIRGTIEWLKEQMADNKRIRVHKYSLPPMLGLYITKNYVFVESYHFGRPEGIEGCIGGYVPLLKIKNAPEKADQNSYAFFHDHFQYLWNETRGSRAELSFESSELIDDSHIKVRNCNDFDIKMAGWNLTAQGKRGYQFDTDFTWQKNKEIELYFSGHEANSTRDVWNIGQLEKNTILTMLNSAGTTVCQWSA